VQDASGVSGHYRNPSFMDTTKKRPSVLRLAYAPTTPVYRPKYQRHDAYRVSWLFDASVICIVLVLGIANLV